MKKNRKRMLAACMAAVLSASFIWQQSAVIYAEPSVGEEIWQKEVAAETGQQENALEEVENSSQADNDQDIEQQENAQGETGNSSQAADNDQDIEQQENALRDVEISSQMVNNYQDIEEEAPLSVSEYLDTISQDGSSLFGGREIPTQFDPRQTGGTPAVRNQGSLGSCWAHSAMAMVEMNLWLNNKLAETNMDNMSEFQTVYFMNHNWEDPLGLCTNDNFHTQDKNAPGQLSKTWYENGGNTAYTQFMLMDWVGAVSETQYPDTAYDELETKLDTAYLKDDYAILNDIAHVKDVTVINTEDPGIIKQMILERGAVGLSYYDQQTTADGTGGQRAYFNSTNNAYYYNDYIKHGNTGTNHAIAVVGWNDGFEKTKFNEGHQPERDGAWLVRNSWGEKWGDGGYFWISYEEPSIAKVAYALEVAVKDSSNADGDEYYDYNYQYDGGIYSGGYTYENGGVQEANIFTAQHKETLKAVAIYTDANYKYRIDIYKLTDNTNPIAGELVSIKEGEQPYKGYHTVKLDTQVNLEEDEIFSVVVTLENQTVSNNSENKSDTFLYIDANLAAPDHFICSSVEAKEGESFRRPYVEGGAEYAWKDMSKDNTPANLRIKAYTDEIPMPSATVENKTEGGYASSYTYGDDIPAPAKENFETTNKDPDTECEWKYVWYSGDQTNIKNLRNLQPLDITAPSDAGTYTLVVTVSSSNYKKAEKRLVVTVDPKQVATAGDTIKAATNSAHTYTYDVSAMLQEEVNGEIAYHIVTTTDTSGIFSSNPSLEGSILVLPIKEAAAEASASVEIAFTIPNYTLENAVLTVELVNKTPVKLSGITFPKSGTYTGTGFAYSGEPVWQTEDGQTAVVAGTDVLYEGTGSTEYSSTEAPVNVGEYRVVFSVKDADEQYTGTESAEFSITKKSATVTAKDKKITVGDQIPSLENSAEGTDYMVEGVLPADTLEGKALLVYTDENGAQVQPDNNKAGTYKISISGLSGSNYEIQYVAGTLTIENKPNTNTPSSGGSGSGGFGSGGSGSGSSGSSGGSGGSSTIGSWGTISPAQDPNKQDDNNKPQPPIETDPVVPDPSTTPEPKKEIKHYPDGTTVVTTTSRDTNEAGNQVDITEIENKDSGGNVLSSSKESVIEISQNGVSTIQVKVEKDATDKVTNAWANIHAAESSDIRENVLLGSMVKQAVQAAEVDSLKVKLRVEDENGSFVYSVTANTADLQPGNDLYIVIRKANGERVLVNAKKYPVLENGDVAGSVKGKKAYELISSSSMDKLSSNILNTVQVKNTSKTIKKSKRAKIELKNTLNMENVKSITYSVSKKSVASVTKNGVIKGKNAGTTVVRAKITLKNGKTKTVKMKLKVK